MAELMFGLENELALSVINSKGRGDRFPHAAHVLVALVGEEVPHLPDAGSGSGMFLANGSRLYVDSGHHPEIAHAEVTDPWTLIRIVLAGEEMLNRAARRLMERSPSTREVILSRSNVDYVSGATWGCHENYLCSGDAMLVMDRLAPFLVTRTVFSGAGGFDARFGGPKFSLSPRSVFIQHEVSENSTGFRGLYHTKDEPLGRSGWRLHLICGEYLSSHLAMFLTCGVTALVVAVLLADAEAADGIRLRQPVAALRTVAADTTLSRRLPVIHGESLTALEIQQRYLECVESHLGDEFMPQWAEKVCREWRSILERLQEGFDAVSSTLDWAIKLRLYKSFVARRGFSWDSLAAWTLVSRRISAAGAETPLAGQPLDIPRLLCGDAPLSDTVRELSPYLDQHGLQWDDLLKYVTLWNDLIEMERRFGMLGEKGIFNQMDSAGLLDHRIADTGNVEEMILNPPPRGRARIRGECVKRLSGQTSNALCDWQFIEVIDAESDIRRLDLSDPFETQERWHPSFPHDSDARSRAEFLQLRLGFGFLRPRRGRRGGGQ